VYLFRRTKVEDSGSRRLDLIDRSHRLQMKLRQLLLPLQFARDCGQLPEGVLQQQQKRAQVLVVHVSELDDLERDRCVVDERAGLGLGESLHEALGQR